MKSKLISIIIPTYNRRDFIVQTIESVIAQTYTNWECIIVDDGSTDDTEDVIANSFKNDSRILYYKRPLNKSKGASSCRNYGLEKARGAFIQFLDSDDLLAPKKLEEQVKVFENNPEAELVTCRWSGFNRDSDLFQRFKRHSHTYENFTSGIELIKVFGRYKEYLPAHIYLTPREIIKRAGLWNENLSNNDDGEFFVRVLLNVRNIHFAPEAMAFYRHTSNYKLSHLDTEEKLNSAINSWKLIERHINAQYPDFEEFYLDHAKSDIYKVAVKKYPFLIKENNTFFKKQRYQSSLAYRIYSRLMEKNN